MTKWGRVGKLKSYTTRDKNTSLWCIRYGRWYRGNPQEGACQKLPLHCITSCGAHSPWDLTFFFFPIFSLSKILWELCHNPLEFSTQCLCSPGCLLGGLCVSWGLCPEITGIKRWTHLLGCQLPCRQAVWCCHSQKVLFSHARLTTESVYFKCCQGGVQYLSNLMLTSLSRTCSSAKTYDVLTCTRSN